MEIAALLGVSDRTVRRWVSAGEITGVRSGRYLLVDLEEAQAQRAKSSLGRVANRREELAELRGRCEELRALVDRLESQLAAERRRAIQLELTLRDRAA